jgi:nucleotide-binding universal stress UspA family protein
MSQYKHILACLDFTHIDEHIIKYSAFLAEIMHTDQITFLHVIQAYQITDVTDEKIREIEQSAWEHIEQKVKKYVKKNVHENLFTQIVIQIQTKDASDEIIDYVRKHKVNLTLFGKKAEEERKERYSARSIALAESDMLVVPEDPPPKISNILAAIDFSNKSKAAFKIGAKLAKTTGSGLSCQYIYSVPKNYFPITSMDAMYDYLKKKGERKIKKFQKKYQYIFQDADYHIELADYDKQDEKVISTASATGSELIILGGKGQTSSPATLLGNMAEKLRKYKSNIPVLIIKNYWEKKSFWNIFFHG